MYHLGHHFPAYEESLDACAEFEAELDKDEVKAALYADHLLCLNHGNIFMTIKSSAHLKCLAFLRTTKLEMFL